MDHLELLAFNLLPLFEGAPEGSLLSRELPPFDVAQRQLFTQRQGSVGKIATQATNDLSCRWIDLIFHLPVDDHHPFIHLIDDALELNGAHFFGSKGSGREFFRAHPFADVGKNENQVTAARVAHGRGPDGKVPESGLFSIPGGARRQFQRQTKAHKRFSCATHVFNNVAQLGESGSSFVKTTSFQFFWFSCYETGEGGIYLAHDQVGINHDDAQRQTIKYVFSET